MLLVVAIEAIVIVATWANCMFLGFWHFNLKNTRLLFRYSFFFFFSNKRKISLK